MEYRLKAYNIWEVGDKYDENGMPHQEDAMFPGYGLCAPEDRVFVLCDGMGGHDNGEIASSVACDTLGRSVVSQLQRGSGIFREGIFDQALTDAYDALDDNDTGSAKKMGTTMAFLCLYEKGYFAAHIGDTRIYHIRPGDDAESTQIVFASTDHSLANKLASSGKATPEEMEAATRRHVITRAMQPHMEVRPLADVEMSGDIRPGDYFVMMTHGMLENLDTAGIKAIFSRQGGNDGNKFRQLCQVTAGNTDNHSAIVVHVEDVVTSRARRVAPVEDSDSNPQQKKKDKSMGKTIHNITRKNKAVIDKFQHRALSSGSRRLLARLLLALMALLTLIMVIYYAFIRTDEPRPETGGAAVELNNYDPYKPDEEKYGYETKSTEVIDDRIIESDTPDDTESEQPAQETPEETAPDATTTSDTPEKAPEPEPAPEPQAEPDVPILQE